MQNICDLDPNDYQFSTLIKDILDKWALPIITNYGVQVPFQISDSLN